MHIPALQVLLSCALCWTRGRQEAIIESMLLDLFAGSGNMRSVARAWRPKVLGVTTNDTGLPPWLDWRRVSSVRHPMESLWIRLTRMLMARSRLPLQASRRSIFQPTCHEGSCLPGLPNESSSVGRRIVELWSASLLAPQGWLATHRRCAETGDGHYIRNFFRSWCTSQISLDKLDRRADFNLDLELPLSSAPSGVQEATGSLDLIISIDVFEHLRHPAIAITTLNALLRIGGYMFWSAPFINIHHGGRGYDDYNRFSTTSVQRLFECGGFKVVQLRGMGNLLSAIANLVGMTPFDLSDADLTAGCDGTIVGACRYRAYLSVCAVGSKAQDVAAADAIACFDG